MTVNAAGLPSGLTTTPTAPISVSASTPQTVTVNCASSVPVGKYTLQLTAASGALSHSGSVALAVVLPSFTLGVSPAALSLAAAGQAQFQVSLQPLYGFTGIAQVQIAGLPSNVTATPVAAFSLTSAAPQTVTVSASTLVGSGSYPLTITATSGSITATATETLNVLNTSPLPSRADFVQTGDTPGGGAYDQKHQRVYVSNPVAGTVDVISSTTYQVLRRIPLPSPQGIDISPDDSTVFIGTGSQIGSGQQTVYALDTATMAITAHYDGPPFGASEIYYPQSPYNPIATPDGNALISVNGSIVKWNPRSGQATTVMSPSPVDLSYSSPFSNSVGFVVAHSGDHSRVIVSNGNYPSTVWLFDTNQNTIVASRSIDGFTYSVAANRDGTQFAAAASGYDQNIYILDANLNTVATVPGGGKLLYSLDATKLYVVGVVGRVAAVSLLNPTTQQWMGSAPSFTVTIQNQSPPTDYEAPIAADETGRIFGSIVNGLAIDDANDLRNYTGNEAFPSDLAIVAPNNGPVGQQQTVMLESGNLGTAPAIWFGPMAATNIVAGIYPTATAPAYAQTGPVNVRVVTAQGVQVWVPQGYTYGAVLSQGPDIAASNDTSTAINIYGYGLGYYPPIGGSSTAGPTTVSFGDHAATTTSVTSTYNIPPLWDVKVQTPKMSVGQTDMTASYGGSSSTLPSSYHAVSINSYAFDGTPYSMAYDARRNRIYVAMTDHVDVFSLSTNAFVSIIQIPTVNNLKQLGGMALTPDGRRLLVANWADGSVAVIDPDNPESSTAIAVGTPPNYAAGITVGPFQIAPTNNGQAYISLASVPQLLKNYARVLTPASHGGASSQAKPQSAPFNGPYTWLLNLQTMAATPVASSGFVPGGYFMAASSDGSQICSANPNNGPMTLFNVASATTVVGPISENEGADVCAVNGGVAVSATQNRNGRPIASDMFMRTLSVAAINSYQYLDLLGPSEDLLTGIAADDTGALMYVPWGQEVALFDIHTGEYRERIALPALLEEMTTGSLLVDQTGKEIFVVSQSGLTVIQLDSLPLAIGSISAVGSNWTVAGVGFLPGTTLAVDGAPQSVAYTDAQHLAVSGAPALSAIHTVTLTNPDGHTYTYDAAYLR